MPAKSKRRPKHPAPKPVRKESPEEAGVRSANDVFAQFLKMADPEAFESHGRKPL